MTRFRTAVRISFSMMGAPMRHDLEKEMRTAIRKRVISHYC